MRIAIDVSQTQLDRSRYRGLGSYVRGLLQGLRQIDTTNEYVLVGYQHGQGDFPQFEEAPTISHFAMPIRPLSQTASWAVDPFRLQYALRNLNVDVYHAPFYSLPLRPRWPVVITIHDLIPFIFPDGYIRDPIRRAIYNWQVRLSGNADCIIADSQQTRNDILRFTSIPDERINVVPVGISPAFIAPCPEESRRTIREKFGLGARYLLFVGEFDRRKPFRDLFTLFAGIRERSGRDLQLVVVGRLGDKAEPIHAALQELGLADHVLLLGCVPEDDLVALYNQAEVLVFPSLYEGFGLPPLEALACGVPVVAYRVSSLPEVVGSAGVLVDCGDKDAFVRAVCDFLTNPDLRATVAERGRQHAAQFTWERTAALTLAVYGKTAGLNKEKRQ